MDACKAEGVDFVVYTSVADAHKATPGMVHFHTKVAVENHLKASGMRWAILRPVAFMENFDNTEFMNPLKKGVIKGMTFDASVKVKHVSTVDVGRVAVKALAAPEAWNGRVLDCAACNISGADAAAVLSKVSGTSCVYKNLLPPFIGWIIMRLLMPDLWHMVQFFSTTGYTSDIPAFKKELPEAMDFEAWCRHKGAWANGEKF